MNRLALESLRSGGSLECSLVEFGWFLRIFGIFEKNLHFVTWDSLEHIGTVVPWEEGFSEVFYISCHVLRCTCRMIIILLPLERATIGQPSRYLQHVYRPSEKSFRGLWNEALPQNYDFPKNLNLRSEVCFFRFATFFNISCHVLLCTCRMIIILLPLERATIGQPSRYPQHVDRPSQKFNRGLWSEFLPQKCDFYEKSQPQIRCFFLFFKFFSHFLPYIAMYVSYDHNFVTVGKSYDWTTL